MPEGPSLVILRERLSPFADRIVREAGGHCALDLSRLRGRRVRVVRSWGKHLLFEFDDITLRMHLLLFGLCRIVPADAAIEGKPTLWLRFDEVCIVFRAASAKWIEGPLDDAYDWSADVLSPAWDPQAARRKLLADGDRLVCDVLLDQSIFAGVGNIMRNEVLFRVSIHPLSVVEALPGPRLDRLVAEARGYGFDFLEWKRRNVLKQHWCVHEQRTCVRCGHPLAKPRQIGMSRRRSFHCDTCQILYVTPSPDGHDAADLRTG